MHARPFLRPVAVALAAFALVVAAWAAPALAVFGDDNDLSPRDEGTVGEIRVHGNAHTDAGLIRHLMGLEPGSAFDDAALDRAWDALEDCGYFRFVEMNYDEAEAYLRTGLDR